MQVSHREEQSNLLNLAMFAIACIVYYKTVFSQHYSANIVTMLCDLHKHCDTRPQFTGIMPILVKKKATQLRLTQGSRFKVLICHRNIATE